MAVPPLDPFVASEIRRLARRELPYAELWRLLRPRVERRGLRCPSYESVRSIAREERRLRARPKEPVGPLEANLWAGRVWIR